MKIIVGAAFVLLLLLVCAYCIDRAFDGRLEALALADSVHIEWEAAERAASVLSDSLELEKARTAVLLGHLEIQRRRADSLAVVTARKAAENEARALETGETLAETLKTARGASVGAVEKLLGEAESQLEEHLEADRMTAAAFRAQIEAMADAREAEAQGRMVWEERAGRLEELLEVRVEECRLCSEEVARLRDVAGPGFFAEVWSHGKAFAMGAGAVLLVVLAR